MRPELRGRWLHEFGDRERKLEVRIGVPGASYSVRGTELPRDSGAWVWPGPSPPRGRLDVFAEYDLLEHSAAIGFRAIW